MRITWRPAAQTQAQALGSRHRLELRGQRRQHIVQQVQVKVRLDCRLVEPGNIQQIAQQIFGTFQRLVRSLHQQLLGLRQLALAQGRNQQACSVERLQQVVAGGGQVLVLAAVGGLGRIACLHQLAGTLGHALLQLVVELLQTLLRQLALGDVGDEPLDHTLLVRAQQQVHQHIDAAAVLASQLGFVTQQGLLALQHLGNVLQLGLAAHEQVAGQVTPGKQHRLGVGIPQHARQRRVGGAQAIVEAGLEDAVHRMLEQP